MIKRKTPIKRSAVMPKRSPVKKKRPGGPRRGRVVDKPYLAWLHTQPGAVHGGRCHSVHHLRFCGSPKDDRRAIPLEFGYHTIQEGPESIEALGKEEFCKLHGFVNLDLTIKHYQDRYLRTHPEVKW